MRNIPLRPACEAPRLDVCSGRRPRPAGGGGGGAARLDGHGRGLERGHPRRQLLEDAAAVHAVAVRLHEALPEAPAPLLVGASGIDRRKRV